MDKQIGINVNGHFGKYAVIEAEVEEHPDNNPGYHIWASLYYNKEEDVEYWKKRLERESGYIVDESKPLFILRFYNVKQRSWLGYDRLGDCRGLSANLPILFQSDSADHSVKKIRFIIPYHPTKVELRTSKGIGYINKENNFVLNVNGFPGISFQEIPFCDNQGYPIMFKLIKVFKYSK